MIRQRRYKCLYCRKLFYQDQRNQSRQQYCSKPDCRRASKAASQKKRLTKPENRDYFRSPENTKRVQQWRKDNPGYWRKGRKVQEPLQDRSTRENTKHQQDIPILQNVALQDLLSTQATVFLGLLAHLGGSPLQDDIVIMGRRLQQLGRDILNESFNPEGGRHDSQQIPLHPHLVRRVPEQLSWIDHCLVRERYIDHLSHRGAILYLFLVTVSDDRGLSYYGEPTL